jgi:hypothetical protein
MNEFLRFDKMITPNIIKIIFVIGSFGCILYGIVTIANGFSGYFNDGALIFRGIVSIILGPLIIRVYCEVVILFFKIHETLHSILEKETE